MPTDTPKNPECDETLAQRARGGDLTAFSELARRYQAPLLRFLARWATGSGESVEDLVQEAFLRVYRTLSTYSVGRPFKPWLFTVSYRVAVERARKRQVHYAGDVAAAADTHPEAGALAEAAEARGNLWRLAQRVLTIEQFSTVCLYYVEDLSVAQVAGVLRKSPTAVKVLLHRARVRLLDALPAEEVPTARGRAASGAGQQMNTRECSDAGV